MASENKAPVIVAGMNKSKKHIQNGIVSLAYLACDADSNVIASITALCREHGVPVENSKTKMELAELCGIEVGCALCVILK